MTDTITVAGRTVTLTRPVATYAAERLQRIIPQLNALNLANKSQSDAAAALDTTVCSLRTWLELTGTSWINIKRRGSYNRTK
jgi:hypothetical protein